MFMEVKQQNCKRNTSGLGCNKSVNKRIHHDSHTIAILLMCNKNTFEFLKSIITTLNCLNSKGQSKVQVYIILQRLYIVQDVK